MSEVKKIIRYIVPNNSDKQIIKSITEFDQNNNILLDINYADEYEIESKTIYEYSGKILKKEINFFDEENISEEAEYFYNQNDKIEKIKISYADESFSIKEYSYNNEKNELQIIQFDEENEVESKEYLKFNSENLLIEKQVFDYDNILIEQIVNKYDNNKNIIYSKEFYKYDDIKTESKYEYNFSNKLTSFTKYNSKNQIIEQIKFTYNTNDKIIEQKHLGKMTIKFSYDEELQQKIEERYDTQGMIVYKAIFDVSKDEKIINEIFPNYEIIYEYQFF